MFVQSPIHPDTFEDGVRVIKRVARNKDAALKRKPSVRVSRNRDEFVKYVSELIDSMAPGERIYASCDPRDEDKAMRMFKQRMLDNDYVENPADFYYRTKGVWESCLDDPKCALTKLFLFDLDDQSQEDILVHTINLNKLTVVHSYKTKNGKHYILNPFNPQLLVHQLQECLHRNASILVAYDS